jgi:hypothetical protein
MFIGRVDDEQDMFKLNQMLKDEFNKQPVDMEAITYFWRKTFPSRRLFTRNNVMKEILLEYPAYALPSLVSCLKILSSSGIIHFTFSDFRRSTNDY